MASKGKGIAEKGSSWKRKRGDNDKAADRGGQKRKNRDVLQFFEDAAFEGDGSDSSYDIDDLFDDADFLDEFDSEPKVKNEPGRFEQVRVFPKEEELSGDELEKMLEERYSSGSGYVRYAEDGYDSKRSVDRSFLIPSVVEPMIWKVKCKVGRERHTVFCLMQKYVDLKVLGNKLQIISAFAVEHIKGFVFIEAVKQSDVAEACNQLADVYFSLVTKVPANEVSQLLVVRQRTNEVKEGTWARVKNGIYKGDIAQVMAVNKERKRATVKLIPRVDIQALAAKYGGGTISKKTKHAVPAARLISSSELEEFRPLMQCRRDRDTGKVFEFLDGLMLKDGFLYKKVSIDSLGFWDVNPTEEELQKFTLPSNDESDNLEWLSQLYGEQKKKCKVTISKGGEKGEGSSGSNEQSSFEVHDLVLFGKRDFGIVIGMEKDEKYKILKYGSEGPVTMTLGQKDLKYLPLEKKFTALDLHMKTISINDTVRILHGPTKGRQGTVKQIYRGIIFLYDENDFDNAYFCAKSQESEKVKHIDSACCGKVEEGTSFFEDVPSSPKSPLAKKPWQMREDAEGRDKDGMFSVGQSLRIRIGPLKGYLCRVLAVRFSDVTVKLDSQQKVLTVKREHLSDVRGKNSATSMSDDTGLNSSFKPFDLLGSDGNTDDWLQGASGSARGDGWNVQGPSGERSAWPSFSSSGTSIQVGTSAGAPPSSVDNDTGREAEDSAWVSKVNSNQNSSWGATGNDKTVGSSDQVGGGWGRSSGTDVSSSWESAKVPSGGHGTSWKFGPGVDLGKEDTANLADPWDKGKKVSNEASSWGKQSADKGVIDAWSKGKGAEEAGGWGSNGTLANVDSSGWGKQPCEKSETSGKGTNSLEQSMGKPSGGTWGEAKGAGGWGKTGSHASVGASSWGKQVSEKSETWGQSMGKPSGGGWSEAKGTDYPAEDSLSKAVGKWGNKNSSNESSEWKSSAAASESQTGAWGQAQGRGMGKPGGDAWGEAKGTSDSAEDSWGKAVGKWGNKNSANDSSGWKNSGAASESQSGGWSQAKEQNTSRGWKNSLDEHSNEKWGKSESGSDCGKVAESSQGVQSWNGSEGIRSWDQPRGSENDQGYRGRGFGGRRGRGGNRGGHDQSGRGRGWSSGRGEFSCSNQENQSGSSWSSLNDGNKDQGSDWGNSKGWSSNYGEGKGWSKPGWAQGSSEPTESNKWNSAEPSSERGNDSGGWKQQASWEKGKSGNDHNSTWGKSTECQNKGSVVEVNEPWAKAKNLESKVAEGASNDTWGKAADKWGSMGNSSRGKEWGSSPGTAADDNKGWAKGHGNSTQSQEEDNGVGWTGASGWKSSGDGGQGKVNTWSKPKSFGAGGASWDKSSENDSWEQSKSFENDRGFNGSRGFGGRRGRGRDQYGRGRGRLSDRGNSSSWNNDAQDAGVGASWRRDQDGVSCANTPAGSDGWKSPWGGGKGWSSNEGGDDKGWNKPDEPGKQVGSEETAAGGWSKGGNSDSSGWKKGGDGSYGKNWNNTCDNDGGGSWSKPAGNDTWERPRNAENDQGFGGGRGSGGRRGRGGFRGGRGQSGRGQFSSWKNDSEGGSSWGPASGGGNVESSWSKGWSNSGGEDKGWGKPGQGVSSSATGASNDQSSSWGKAKGWNDKGADNADKESAGNKGGSSWSNSSGGNNGGNNWGRDWSNSRGEEDKGGSKPSQGISSWGASEGNDQGGGWGKAKNFNDNEGNEKGSGGNKSWGADKGESKPSEGISSWGASKSNDHASGWGKAKSLNDNEKGSAGNKSWGADKDGSKPSEGISSWGTGKSNDQGSSWGKAKGRNDNEKGDDKGSDGNKSWGASSSWGNSTSGGSKAEGGGGGWA